VKQEQNENTQASRKCWPAVFFGRWFFVQPYNGEGSSIPAAVTNISFGVGMDHRTNFVHPTWQWVQKVHL
jgi:hypothetical protein